MRPRTPLNSQRHRIFLVRRYLAMDVILRTEAMRDAKPRDLKWPGGVRRFTSIVSAAQIRAMERWVRIWTHLAAASCLATVGLTDGHGGQGLSETMPSRGASPR